MDDQPGDAVGGGLQRSAGRVCGGRRAGQPRRHGLPDLHRCGDRPPRGVATRRRQLESRPRRAARGRRGVSHPPARRQPDQRPRAGERRRPFLRAAGLQSGVRPDGIRRPREGQHESGGEGRDGPDVQILELAELASRDARSGGRRKRRFRNRRHPAADFSRDGPVRAGDQLGRRRRDQPRAGRGRQRAVGCRGLLPAVDGRRGPYVQLQLWIHRVDPHPAGKLHDGFAGRNRAGADPAPALGLDLSRAPVSNRIVGEWNGMVAAGGCQYRRTRRVGRLGRFRPDRSLSPLHGPIQFREFRRVRCRVGSVCRPLLLEPAGGRRPIGTFDRRPPRARGRRRPILRAAECASRGNRRRRRGPPFRRFPSRGADGSGADVHAFELERLATGDVGGGRRRQ